MAHPLVNRMELGTTPEKAALVENTLNDLDFHPTKKQLYDALRGKMTYAEFQKAFTYLKEEVVHIDVDRGEIISVHNPRLIEYIRKNNPDVYARCFPYGYA